MILLPFPLHFRIQDADNAAGGKRFGLKILQPVFGLSNDDACGLYTSNPLTIRALEDATFRHIDVRRIALRRRGW